MGEEEVVVISFDNVDCDVGRWRNCHSAYGLAFMLVDGSHGKRDELFDGGQRRTHRNPITNLHFLLRVD